MKILDNDLMPQVAFFPLSRSALASSFFCIFILIGCFLNTSWGQVGPRETSVNGTSAMWRKSTNDGINALFLQLRQNGIKDSYSDFLAKVGDSGQYQTFDSLARLASQFDVNLKIRHLTLSQLSNIQTPVTVYVEPEGIARGSFDLLIGYDANSFLLIQGGTVGYSIKSRESFIKEWSGYALVFTPTTSWSTIIFRIASMSATILILLDVFSRRAKLKKEQLW